MLYNAAMIAHLRGRLIAKEANQAIIECGGVGYDVVITVPTYTSLPAADGAEVSLHVYTNVREDQIALFGFLKLEEKRLFEKLIAVSGIGPGLAIKILSGQTSDSLVGCIKSGDAVRLTKIPGVGKKTAERMVLELRDKLKDFAGEATPSVTQRKPLSVEDDVMSALLNLGYQTMAAEKALDKVDQAEHENFERLFRAAMALLSK